MGISDDQIGSVMDVEAFVTSCDEAFRLYGQGVLRNLPREESVEQEGDEEVFRLELAGEWEGVLKGNKVIVERSDVSTGRLGERSARITVHLEGEDEPRTVDAELITNRRTGAAAVLAAQYLAGASDSVAIVGTGRIAEEVALAADHLLQPARLRVTSRKASSRRSFLDKVGPLVNTVVEAADDVEHAVRDADVVVTCVPTPEPVIESDWLRPDAHLSVVGGDPRTVQLTRDILRTRPIVVDHYDQALRSGDFVRYADAVSDFSFMDRDGEPANIGDAALGRLESARGSGVVAYFTGMAVQDLHATYVAITRLGT